MLYVPFLMSPQTFETARHLHGDIWKQTLGNRHLEIEQGNRTQTKLRLESFSVFNLFFFACRCETIAEASNNINGNFLTWRVFWTLVMPIRF